MRKWIERLPVPYRILCGQFLLRVVDLESLSIQADVPRYLGQFAGVLLMVSMIHALVCYAALPGAAWMVEQYLMRTNILVAGLIAVMCWDSAFPDRRDAIVLGTLPVRARTILLAKTTAMAGLIGLGVLALNAACGVMAALCLGRLHGAWWGFFQVLAAYWVAMVAAALFVYAALLAVQGWMAALLPRAMFLRVSAAMQVVAFTALLGMYFLQSSIGSYAAMMAARNRIELKWSPVLWFFALMDQLNGSLPAELKWVAWRGWIALGVAVCGAASALLLCYWRTMKRTVEQPDLVPAHRSGRWRLPLHGVRGTIVLFGLRTLLRSRHHRVAYAFYMSLMLSIAFAGMRSARSRGAMTASVLMESLVMLAIAVWGLRGLFSLPISLNANWVMRVTQRGTPERYVAAARTMLWMMAAAPAWICAAAIMLSCRGSGGFAPAGRHLLLIAVAGLLFVEAGLVGMARAPFACSYLPGRSNVQVRFWGFLLGFLPLAMMFARYERRMLYQPMAYAGVLFLLAAATAGLWWWNTRRARTAVLQFEDVEADVVTTLGIASARPAGLLTPSL
jgi:hypothetical protein